MTGRNETRAFLGLGGNVGEPAMAMAGALQALDRHQAVHVLRVSSLYRTPPWGKEDQPDFLNAAAAVATTLAPRLLLDLCLQVERDLKRERRERWGPRSIDLDILLYGDRRVDEEGLTVPHPHMTERAFVLVPLAEIAPGLPIDGRPIGEHLRRLDTGGIERLDVDADWWRNEAWGG